MLELMSCDLEIIHLVKVNLLVAPSKPVFHACNLYQSTNVLLRRFSETFDFHAPFSMSFSKLTFYSKLHSVAKFSCILKVHIGMLRSTFYAQNLGHYFIKRKPVFMIFTFYFSEFITFPWNFIWAEPCKIR